MNDEMVRGYLEGRDPDSPKPSDNRSASYRHGWLNGRDDLSGKPRASAEVLRKQAEWADATDRQHAAQMQGRAGT